MITYLEPNRIEAKKVTAMPTYGRNADGYGSKIPTSMMVLVEGRWRRVYVTQYSNAGSAWITLNKEKVFVGDTL